MATVVAFLKDAGLDAKPEIVQQDVAGGRGLGAKEALLIRANVGTFKPTKESGGAGAPADYPGTATPTK